MVTQGPARLLVEPATHTRALPFSDCKTCGNEELRGECFLKATLSPRVPFTDSGAPQVGWSPASANWVVDARSHQFNPRKEPSRQGDWASAAGADTDRHRERRRTTVGSA